MYTAKTKRPGNQKADDSFVERQSTEIPVSSFTDNRPEVVAQLKLQEEINNNSRVTQLKAMQQMMNDSPRMNQLLDIQKPVKNTESRKTTQFQAMTPSYTMQTIAPEAVAERHKPAVQRQPVVQRTKHGENIDYTFNSPAAVIKPVFSDSNRVFGASKFNYDVTFKVDSQGTENTPDYRIGEFRQYYKGGTRVFGKKFKWKNDWVEDTLTGNDHYGYRNGNTQSSKYIINEDNGDKLQMYDQPEIEGVDKPDEIAYDQQFKGEVVAVDGPGGNVKKILETKYWEIKGLGTRDKNDKIYYGVYHWQLDQKNRVKSNNKSKRARKEEAGKYDKPEPDG